MKRDKELMRNTKKEKTKRRRKVYRKSEDRILECKKTFSNFKTIFISLTTIFSVLTSLIGLCIIAGTSLEIYLFYDPSSVIKNFNSSKNCLKRDLRIRTGPNLAYKTFSRLF
jgi:hypothetical protein